MRPPPPVARSRVNRSRAAIGLLAGCLSAAAAPAEVVERILAVVDSRPLMLSEVRLVEQLRGLGRPAALEALVDEQLMLREASRLAQSVVRMRNRSGKARDPRSRLTRLAASLRQTTGTSAMR